jgi:uncharacterized surface anchored protein
MTAIKNTTFKVRPDNAKTSDINDMSMFEYGVIVYDTDLNVNKYWNGTCWVANLIVETQIDLGDLPVSEASIYVSNPNVKINSNIIGAVAYKKPTNKDLDELDMDTFNLKFEPLNGGFNVKIKGNEGNLHGEFIIFYAYNL